MSVQVFDKFMDLLRSFDTGMLVTQPAGAHLHGRPMAIADVEPEDCVIWFITADDSPKMSEIRSNNTVLVTFQDGRDRFVSLAGRAEVVQDRRKIDELWREPFKLWFPEGRQDPNLALIRIQGTEGEYWDNAGANKISFVMEAARAALIGEKIETQEPFQHGRVDI